MKRVSLFFCLAAFPVTLFAGGNLSGFREVYMTLEQTRATAGEGDATLAIENPFMSSGVVSLRGARIGIIEPFETATIRGVAPGDYQIQFVLPDGYAVTLTFTAKP